MADRKISELTSLTGAQLADDDVLVIVDTSANETKKISYTQLRTRLDDGTGFVRVTGDTMTGSLNIQTSSGYGSIELLGPSGAFIDFRDSTADDYDARFIKSTGLLDIISVDSNIRMNMPSGSRLLSKRGMQINTEGEDSDTVISGDSVTNLFYVNAGDDAVIIGNNAQVGIDEGFAVFSDVTNNNYKANVAFVDTSDFDATGPRAGGGLGFGYKYTSSNYAVGPIIKGEKDNTTSGDYGANMQFWTRPNGNHPAERVRILSTGEVGINTTSPSAKLHVVDDTAVGSDVNDYRRFAVMQGHTGNVNALDYIVLRTSQGGTDWTTAAVRMQARVDSTEMGYLQFNGASGGGSVAIGAGQNSGGYHLIPENARFTGTGAYFNAPQNDQDFRISTSSVQNAFLLDSGLDQIGLFTGSLASRAKVTISGTANYDYVHPDGRMLWVGSDTSGAGTRSSLIVGKGSYSTGGNQYSTIGMHPNHGNDGFTTGFDIEVEKSNSGTSHAGFSIVRSRRSGSSARSLNTPFKIIGSGSPNVVINDDSTNFTSFRVKSDSRSYAFYVDADTGFVGVNDGDPASDLTVDGRVETKDFQYSGGDGSGARLGRMHGWSDDNSSSGGATWRKIGTITLPDANFSSIGLVVKTFYAGSNYSAYNYTGSFWVNQVNVTRKDTGVVDAGDIHGPVNNKLRLHRNNAGEWELQGRAQYDNQAVMFEVMQSASAGGASFEIATSVAAGSTGGTTVTADGASNFNEHMSNIYNYGNAEFNYGGADRNFRIQSDAKTHAFYVDGEYGVVGINSSGNTGYDLTLGSQGLNVNENAALSHIVGNTGYSVNTGNANTSFRIAQLNGIGGRIKIRAVGSIGYGNPGFQEYIIEAGQGNAADEFAVNFYAVGNSDQLTQPSVFDSEFLVYTDRIDGDSYDLWIYLGNYCRLDFFAEQISGGSLKFDNYSGTGASIPATAVTTNNESDLSFGAASIKNFAYSSATGTAKREVLTSDYSAVVVNAENSDVDFRVHTDDDSNVLFVNGGDDNITMYKAALSDSTVGHDFRSNGQATFVCNNTTRSLQLNNTSGAEHKAIHFQYSGATRGSIDVSTNGTIYLTSSDRRLKDDIEAITDGTDKVMAMKPVTYKWKADPDADAVHGFIAQDMQEVVPEAVKGKPDGDEMMTMDYGRITPVLVAALQDAHKKIEALEARLTELEAD